MSKSSPFKPAWYLKNPHLQTILANIRKPPFPEVSYETVKLEDGDSLQLAYGTTRGPSSVLLLHGLEGSLNSAYPRRMINFLNQRNIPVVLMFFRGCSGEPNARLRSYHSGETSDLREVIAYLKQQGVQRIALIGYSLGGNVTLKYMGEGKVDESVICATGVSVPMQLEICANRMSQGFSRIYQYSLLKRLLRKNALKRNILENAGFSLDQKINTFFAFDDAYTAPIHGFNDAMDYYQQCSSRQFLKTIKKPTLILHARDDPFMTTQVIPQQEELSDQVRLEISTHGGHVGFIQKGLWNPQNWLEPRLLQWLEQQFL